MSDRLPSGVLVGALLRRVNDAGGMGMMLARGDAQGGGILVIALKAGRTSCVLERGSGPGGAQLVTWTPPDIDDSTAVTDYWQRRRRNDPDLWVIELDSPFAERFTAETILPG